MTGEELFAIIETLNAEDLCDLDSEDDEYESLEPSVTVEAVQNWTVHMSNDDESKICADDNDENHRPEIYGDDERLDPTYKPNDSTYTEDEEFDKELLHENQENEPNAKDRQKETGKQQGGLNREQGASNLPLRQVNTVVADHIAGQDKVVGRKRRRNPDMWLRNVRKKNSAGGKTYVNQFGKNIPESKVGNPCQCRKKCFERLGDEFIKKTHN